MKSPKKVKNQDKKAKDESAQKPGIKKTEEGSFMYHFKKLKEFRKAAPGRLTQGDVAKAIGQSRTNYQKKEAGEIITLIADLEKLSELYKRPISDWFGESDIAERKNLEQEKEELTKMVMKLQNSLFEKDELTKMVMKLQNTVFEKEEEIKALKKKLNLS